MQEMKEEYPDNTILLIPKDAINGDDSQTLLYKLLLLNTLYGKDIDVDKAAQDLEKDSPFPIYNSSDYDF
jgi:hypothetical protein